MFAGSITTSQSCGSPTTADQSVSSIESGQPAIIAGTIYANSINVAYNTITVDQNPIGNILPVSCNDINVSKGNTIATRAKSLPHKEGIKLLAKYQMK